MKALLAVLVLALPAAAGDQARVKGRVTAKPRVESSAHGDSNPYKSRNGSYAERFDYAHLKDVVVSAEPAVGGAAGPTGDVKLTLETGRYGARFSPAFVVVGRGQKLAVENKTTAAMAIAAGGASPESMEFAVPGGQTRVVAPGARGLYELTCLTCASKSPVETKVFAAGAYVAQAGPDGAYALELPPGSYTVTAWHERLPARGEMVTLKPGETHELDFTLSVRDLPQVP